MDREGRKRFPRESRIRLSSEIRGLLRNGRRRRTSHLDFFVRPSSPPSVRMGVIVPKHGHKIVERNLLRRRIREAGRRVLLPELLSCGANSDVLVRARPEAYGMAYSEVVSEMISISRVICSGPSF